MKNYFSLLSSQNWGILDSLFTEKSPIDLPRLAIKDQQDAFDFVFSYGYNLNHAEEASEVASIRQEAIQFIQQTFLEPFEDTRELEIPRQILQSDLLELLVLASTEQDNERQAWACAILRVMHALSHITSDLAHYFFPSIVEQILAPYQAHIEEQNGQKYLGKSTEFQLPLIDFEIKAGKDRRSTLIKLLHKPENVAAHLFDRIGIRFITRDRLDAVLVLHYLREHNLVAFPNIQPDRLNNLIDIQALRAYASELNQHYAGQIISFADLETTLRQFTNSDNHTLETNEGNPHSSADYRSIQFTVRQSIRWLNPLSSGLTKIEMIDQQSPKHMFELALPNHPETVNREHYRFFFPYEIQIVDHETHLNNMQGQASHTTYKQRQIETARKRIMQSLIPLNEAD